MHIIIIIGIIQRTFFVLNFDSFFLFESLFLLIDFVEFFLFESLFLLLDFFDRTPPLRLFSPSFY
jgi:hypothetical protein